MDRLRGGPRPTVLEVRLNARLQPVHRGDRYEDPLAFLLEEAFPGCAVTGGGTLVSPDGEPLSCAVDADVVGDLDTVIEAVVELMERQGAPRGSSIEIDGRPSRPFGSTDGLALRLDGTGLPDEVYADNDVNDLVDQVRQALVPIGQLHSFWEGPTETALYLYGDDAARMLEALAPVLAANPLLEGARLEQIA